MDNRFKSLFTIICLGLSLLAMREATGQVNLRWKFAKGDQFDIKMSQVTQTSTKVGGKLLSLKMQTAMWLNWTVNSVDSDGRAVITQKFTRLATKTTAPDGKSVAFDTVAPASKDASKNETLKTVRPLLNSQVQITLAPWGEIENAKLSSETASLLGDIPALSQIKKLLTAEGLNQTLRQSIGILPGNAINPNDTWQSKSEIDSPTGKIKLSNRFTYTGPDKIRGPKLHRIKVSTAIQLPTRANDASPPNAGKPLQQSGELWFDVARGHLAKSEIRQTMTSTTQLMNNHSIRLDATSQSTFELQRQ